MDSGFYITLQSNQSVKYFPSNSSNNFSIKLGKSILLPNNSFEVGLAQMFLSPLKPLKDADGKPIISTEDKFFGKRDNDNQIQVAEIEGSVVTFQKFSSNEIIELLTRINSYFTQINLAFKIYPKIIDGKISSFIIKNEEETLSIVFPLELTDVLGFDLNLFGRGEFQGKHEFSQSAYDELKYGFKFEFKLLKQTFKNFTVAEPEN